METKVFLYKIWVLVVVNIKSTVIMWCLLNWYAGANVLDEPDTFYPENRDGKLLWKVGTYASNYMVQQFKTL
jgi:hypothetical protein